MGGVTFRMAAPSRCVIAKELYWGNGQRPRTQDQYALDCFATLARKSSLVLDVGAYTGIFSILAATVNPNAEVHAFELIPSCASGAVDNLVLNDLLGRVIVHFSGVGSRGVVRVPTGKGGSALPDFLSVTNQSDHGVRVRVQPLTDFGLPEVQPKGISRTLVKIDVEGTEDDVLLSASELFSTQRPDILCELLPGIAKVDLMEELLREWGYRFLLVRDGYLECRSNLEPEGAYRDWLFTCRSKQELRTLGLETLDKSAGDNAQESVSSVHS